MCKAHAHATNAAFTGHANIAAKMMRSKPELAAMLPQIFEYVEKWSGGKDPIFMNRVLAFSRTLPNPHFGTMDGPFLDKIIACQFGTGRWGRYRAMMMNMQLVFPHAFNTKVCNELKKPGNILTTALKGEADAIDFDNHVRKLPQLKGNEPSGNVTYQVGML
jgi:hypothetical protein